MGADDVGELLKLLSKRRSFLASLYDEPKEKPELAADCEVARSTVGRAIRELEMAGLVVRGDEGFELTVPGRLVVDQFHQFEGSVDAICGMDELLSTLPRPDLIPPAMFVDGEVTQSDIHAPDKAMQETVDLVSTAERVRGVSPAVHGVYVETFNERIQRDGLETELVFSADALTELATTYADYIMGDADGVTIYQIEELPPLGLMLVDHEDGTTEASVGIYTDNGVQVVVRNTNPNAVAGLREAFESYRAEATEIQL
ncbi:helix-turn-helix transcriptional regulator [Haloarchaeobius iranensis]|uniref:Predicted transcriptional regulator, contains HTH domain n=1 Tax=Haloarchaeobius iranensis TaxID=996166 RepID=A0A1G9Y057_9EURY|nr:hypothetical protein [Haloarchaeobius iranensis]SDN02106.1 Predicted transcriptional regulator, contains HTH domain [Haloarchaeobius iranensis]